MSANYEDPAKLFHRYLDGLIEMGIKPGPTLMIALAERSASEAKSERINDETKPAPRSIWQEIWGWRKWVMKAFLAGAWLWAGWYNAFVTRHPVFALVSIIAMLVCLISALWDILKREEQGWKRL